MEQPVKVANYTSQRKAQVSVRVTYNSAIDLLFALWILGARMVGEGLAELDLGDEWFDDLAAGMSKQTAEDLESLGSGDVWIGLVALLPEAGEGGGVAEFIEFIENYDPVDLRVRLTQCYDLFGPDKTELIADVAEGRDGSADELLSLDIFDKPSMKRWRETLRFLLEMTPEETQALLVRTLSGFQEDVFAPHEEAFRKQLEADFQAKSAMALRISPGRLIEIATSGITLSDEHVTRPIVLMPSMVARPWVVMSAGADFDVYGYSVADEFLDLDPDTPPPWLVKTYKALGDERRLRILRRLGEGNASLAELARDADVAKSTLHHHLLLLRAAGLVTVEVGADRQYSLRESTLAEAASVLDLYMHPTNDSKDGNT
jgi:DNA-binding transcriptional ArsR family regulator